jgi:hypothetical protein
MKASLVLDFKSELPIWMLMGIWILQSPEKLGLLFCSIEGNKPFLVSKFGIDLKLA